MKANLGRAALACAVLAVMHTAAMGGEHNPPFAGTLSGANEARTDAGTAQAIYGQHTAFMWQGIRGISVSVTNKAGNTVMRAQTDGKGQIALNALAPGDYELVLDGPSFVAAMDKLAPAKKSDGVSVSIGGFFGGGSSHSSSGHEGTGHGQSSSHSSGGGVGVGLSMPVGDNGSPTDWVRLAFEAGYSSHELSIDSPYCRDTAEKGMRIRFSVPEDSGSAAASRVVALGVFHAD